MTTDDRLPALRAPPPAYRPLVNSDMGAVAYLERQGFGTPREVLDHYRALFGDEVMRVTDRGGRVTGFAAMWPFPQWFGGAPVPSRAIASVVTDPTLRGQGDGTALMTGLLNEAAHDGAGVAVLYASTRSLYRKMGFAPAGVVTAFRTPARALSAERLSAFPRLPASLDMGHLADLRRPLLAQSNGMAERTPAMWSLALRDDSRPADVFLLPGPGGDGPDEGYLAVCPPDDRRLVVVDHCILTPHAARTAATFLAGYAMQADWVVWKGAYADPLALGAVDSGTAIEEWEEWLLRIVNVERALSTRGYPAGLNGSAVLEVTDPLLPANNGRFRLDVTNQRAVVRRLDGPGPFDLKLSVSALASLFTGHTTPAALSRAHDIISLNDSFVSLLLSGPPPWMPDRF